MELGISRLEELGIFWECRNFKEFCGFLGIELEIFWAVGAKFKTLPITDAMYLRDTYQIERMQRVVGARSLFRP